MLVNEFTNRYPSFLGARSTAALWQLIDVDRQEG
jgi:hypothetical protein